MVESNNQNTDIEAMRAQAQRSGLSYNQAKAYIAMTSGGRGTNIYSDTNVEEVRKQNQEAEETNIKFGQNN